MPPSSASPSRPGRSTANSAINIGNRASQSRARSRSFASRPRRKDICRRRALARSPSFADALIAWIEKQPKRPDILHAHYADAGVVASIVRERLGIPFVFISHSLGQVKADAFKHSDDEVMADEAEGLKHRLAAEERALADAALVIASSRDEAEIQYAGYASYDPGKIRIVPPGSDLDVHQRQVVDCGGSHDQPLPGRPTSRRCSPSLVRWRRRTWRACQGVRQESDLQNRANLVIIAGTRKDIDDLEPGAKPIQDPQDDRSLRSVRQGFLSKDHRPEDIPALYAYARAAGIFVNPASTSRSA